MIIGLLDFSRVSVVEASWEVSLFTATDRFFARFMKNRRRNDKDGVWKYIIIIIAERRRMGKSKGLLASSEELAPK